MAITITDVSAFADQWYTAIMKEHVGEQKQSEFFIIPSKAYIVLCDGSVLLLDQHDDIHGKFSEEHYTLDKPYVTELSCNPDRVRVKLTLYWQAQFKEGLDQSGWINAAVGVDWILARDNNHCLKFVSYRNSYLQVLPESGVDQGGLGDVYGGGHFSADAS